VLKSNQMKGAAVVSLHNARARMECVSASIPHNLRPDKLNLRRSEEIWVTNNDSNFEMQHTSILIVHMFRACAFFL